MLNYVNRVEVLIPKYMLISIKFFFISLNNKIYAPVFMERGNFWKKLFKFWK